VRSHAVSFDAPANGFEESFFNKNDPINNDDDDDNNKLNLLLSLFAHHLNVRKNAKKQKEDFQQQKPGIPYEAPFLHSLSSSSMFSSFS
jgi:hypothetical protein